MRLPILPLAFSLFLPACGGNGDDNPPSPPVEISQACPNDPRPEIPIAFIAVSEEEISRVGKEGIFYVCQVPR